MVQVRQNLLQAELFLFALAGFATLLLLGTQAGYAVGRIISSKSTTKILNPERMLYIQHTVI